MHRRQIFLSFSIVLLLCRSVYAQPPLAQVGKRAIESESDAVIVIRNNEEVLRYLPSYEKPMLIETMSMTKSFSSLAIGFLIDKKIFSLDESLTKWFPEWKHTLKSKITLRHILTQTSGLEAKRDAGDIYGQKDVVKFALDATLKDDPGTVHFYNNKAVNLIDGIVKKASGTTIDQYLKKKLFDPLGIKKFYWQKDSSGNPLCMAGLRLSAEDLAKIGQFLLGEGLWKGHRLLSKNWIKESITPSHLNENYGLLWWLNYSAWVTKVRDEELKAYRDAGLSKAFIDALAESQTKLDFKFYQLRTDRKDLASAFTQFELLYSQKKIPYPHQVPVGSPIGFSAEGAVGQQLVIILDKKIVGVRQRIKKDMGDEGNGTIQFEDFPKLLMAL